MLLLGEDADHMEVKVQRNFDASGSDDSRYSSTVVRDVHRWDGDLTPFVPPPVEAALRKK